MDYICIFVVPENGGQVITVARRFKKRGISWYKNGANPLLRLRLLKLNGEWDAYWQHRQKEYIRYAA